jgi:predicted DNA-binding protein with PD1-like motif
MNIRLVAKNWIWIACLLSGVLILVPQGHGADTAVPKVFGGAQFQEIYRIRLDRGDLVLESLNAAIKEHNIQDGAVLTGVGSVQECTYHSVKSLTAVAEDQFFTVKGPTEILNLDGIIAAGEPHLHITLSNIKRGAFGGHLENGCRVLYRVELTVAKFSGSPLARKPNKDGTPALQEK